ncbi:MAG: HdeD family acid-resistance protein [Pirellulales bacterium]|nr:HdeD family acid-resistance protein [Pirellulales bacterium]
MNTSSEKVMEGTPETAAAALCKHELQHLCSHWCWILGLGIFLALCGTVSVVYPAVTSLAAVSVLGIILIIGGVVMIVGSFWAGKWSGFLVQLLVGILYLAGGMAVTQRPVVSTLLMTFFLALSFIVLGLFRTVAALMTRFPQWGWALLNGVITFLLGVVIYRQLPFDALWVIGLLVGVELLLNGWTWIMIALEIRKLPQETS